MIKTGKRLFAPIPVILIYRVSGQCFRNSSVESED